MKNKAWWWLIFLVLFGVFVYFWWLSDWEWMQNVRGLRWFANKGGL